MVINLITFASLLHKQASVRSSHEIVLAELEKYFTVRFVDYQQMNSLTPDDFSILFIATGGVERLVIQHFEQLPRPTILLADGMQNSLAAALEISSWLRTRGMRSEILHGELTEIIKRLLVMYNNFKAQRKLNGSRIGVIGTPSSWLISSNVDYLLATEGEINAKSYGTSTINAKSYGTSTINAKSYDTSTINAKSYDTSTINAESCHTSTINAESCGSSTMIIRTSTIECKVKDKSIARYVYENRIVVADDSIKVEKAQ